MSLSPITTLFLILASLLSSAGIAEICRSPHQDDLERAQALLEASHKGCWDGNAQLCRSEKAALTLLSGALEEHTSITPAAAAGNERGYGKYTGRVNATAWMRQGWGDGESSEAMCSGRLQRAAAAHPQVLPHTDQREAQTWKLPSSSKETASSSSAASRRIWAVLARRSLLAALFAFSLALLLTVRHIDDAPSWLLHCIAWALSVPVMQLQRERPSRVLKYLMDVYVFSRSYSKMLLLSILTGTLIAYGGIALYAVAPEEEGEGQGLEAERDISGQDGKTSLSEAMWAAAAGAGFDWAFFPSSSAAVRVVSLLIAVCGSFITAALLTLVSDALGERVDELKSGRGAVLETGHLLILGWSERVFSLLEQLALGCELSGGSTVVILSDQNKEKCMEEIWRRGIDMKKNRLVIREGSIHSVPELQKVCAPLARSILILTDPQDFSADARTLRCLLCLQSANPAVSEGALTAGVLAEMCHADQADLLMQLAGEDNVRTVCSPGLMGRLMVQCTRYPRLIEVLQEIVGFQGSETYISTNSQPLVGLPFGFLQSAYEHAVPLGLRKAKSDMPLLVNPPYGELVEEGDHVILLAEDEACLGLCSEDVLAGLHEEAKKEAKKLRKQALSQGWEPSQHRFQSSRQWQRSLSRIEASNPDQGESEDSTHGGGFSGNFLLIGWRRDIVSMIRQLDSFLTGPSVLFLYSNKPLADRRQLLMQSGLEFSLEEGGLQPLSLTHLRLRYNEPWLVGEAALKSQIQVLYPLEFKAVLILAQDTPLSIADADSRTIATLMNLRQVQVEDLRSGRRPPEDHPLRNPTHHPRETPPSASRHTSSQGSPIPDSGAWSLKDGCPGGPQNHSQQIGACANGAHEVESLSQEEAGAAESEKGLSSIAEEPRQGPVEPCSTAPILKRSPQLRATSLLSVAAKLKSKGRSLRMRSSDKEAARCQGGESKGAVVVSSRVEEHTKWEEQLRELQEVIQRCVVVTELLDKSANALMHGLELSVRVLPNNLLSQIMALTMLSFERIDILEHLFNPAGNMLYVRPVSWLMPAQEEEDDDVQVSFMRLARMSIMQGDVLLGYVDNMGSMKLNPERKTEPCLSRSNIDSLVTVSCQEK